MINRELAILTAYHRAGRDWLGNNKITATCSFARRDRNRDRASGWVRKWKSNRTTRYKYFNKEERDVRPPTRGLILPLLLWNEHRTCPSLIEIYCQICYKATTPPPPFMAHPPWTEYSTVSEHVSCIYTPFSVPFTRQDDRHRLQFNYYVSGLGNRAMGNHHFHPLPSSFSILFVVLDYLGIIWDWNICTAGNPWRDFISRNLDANKLRPPVTHSHEYLMKERRDVGGLPELPFGYSFYAFASIKLDAVDDQESMDYGFNGWRFARQIKDHDFH